MTHTDLTMKRSRLILLAAAFVLIAAPALSLAAEAEEAPPSLVKSFSESGITAIVTLIVFVTLVVVLTKKAWGPIAKGLAAREAKIRKDIADAEEARAKAEAVLADYNRQLADAEARGRDILAKAKTDADALAAQIRTRGQQEAEEARERATREIEEAKNQAIHEIHQQAATLATTVAEKIIKRSLNANDYRDLVDQSIGELQEMKS